jgi:hypothetical protein
MSRFTTGSHSQDDAALYAELGIDQWTDEAVARAKEEAEANKPAKRALGKLVEGRNVLRIGPARKGFNKGDPFLLTHWHTVDIPGQTNACFFPCRRLALLASARGDCAVCRKSVQMRGSTNARDQELGDKIAPGVQYLFNAVNRARQTPAWQVGKFGLNQYTKVLGLRDPKTVGVDFVHPTRGQDIIIIRTGSTPTGTRYQEMLDPRGCTPLLDASTPTSELAAFLATMHDLGLDAMPLPLDAERAYLRGEKLEWDAIREETARNYQKALAGGVTVAGGLGAGPQRPAANVKARVNPIAAAGPQYDEDGNPVGEILSSFEAGDDDIPF